LKTDLDRSTLSSSSIIRPLPQLLLYLDTLYQNPKYYIKSTFLPSQLIPMNRGIKDYSSSYRKILRFSFDIGNLIPKISSGKALRMRCPDCNNDENVIKAGKVSRFPTTVIKDSIYLFTQ